MRRSLVAGLVFVVGLGACGSGVKSTAASTAKVSAQELVAGSADAAAAHKTARISGTEVIRVDGKRSSLPIDGVVDFVDGSAEMRLDASSMGLPGLDSIEARMVNRVMYMDFAKVLSGSDVPEELRGKRWITLDLSQSGQGTGGGSVAGMLESLRGAGDVHRIGSQVIDGVSTVHYHAIIDTARALARVKPGPLRDLAAKGLEQMGPTYPVDVWIDDQGLTRREEITIETSRFAMHETVDYRDFGTPLHVVAPPAGETVDFVTFLRALRSSGAAATN